METKRLFIAIKINPSAELIRLLKLLKKEFINDKMNWAHPDKMHLTLKFLGETETNRIPEITEKLKAVSSAINKFSFTIRNLGAFHQGKYPKILWLHIFPNEGVKNLASKINSDLAKFGFKQERKYTMPHLTLARVKYANNISHFNSVVKDNKIEFAQYVKVEDFYLYESKLAATGAVYNKLETFKLK